MTDEQIQAMAEKATPIINGKYTYLGDDDKQIWSDGAKSYRSAIQTELDTKDATIEKLADEVERLRGDAIYFAEWVDDNRMEIDFREERSHTIKELYAIFQQYKTNRDENIHS